MKSIRVFLLVLIVIGIGLLFTQGLWVPPLVSWILRPAPAVSLTALETATSVSDYKDATYTIDGRSVTLANGKAASESAPGSASKVMTQYFGNQAVGDLNGDGVPDVAFILTQEGGGSGTFYYVVAALKSGDGYHGTNAVLLGDRIAPQTTEIKNGELIVNYAERKAGEPMTAQPSMGVSKYLTVIGGTLTAAQ